MGVRCRAVTMLDLYDASAPPQRDALERLALDTRAAAFFLAARLDNAVQVLVEDGQVLGLAPGQRPDERGGQRAAVSARS